MLLQHHCLLGGGAAAVLTRGEYREVRRIELCCHSVDAYRAIRSSVASQDAGWLFKEPTTVVREPHFDRHGIRLTAVLEGIAIKIQIILESRFTMLAPPAEGRLEGVWTLSGEDLVATKLTANADRYADDSFMSRDIIDLAMIANDGWLSPSGVAKARSVYQRGIDTTFVRAKAMLLDNDAHLARCMRELKMTLSVQELRTRVERLHVTDAPCFSSALQAEQALGDRGQANNGAQPVVTTSRSAPPTASV